MDKHISSGFETRRGGDKQSPAEPVPLEHCPTPNSPCRWLSSAAKTLG